MDPQFFEQLHDPAVFPERGDAVTVLQTHLSVVCLLGNRAYKIKKPLRLAFVDFSTLAQRKYFCEEELRLNRRLCPEIYLRVVSFVFDERGHLRVEDPENEASSRIVEYAVEMVRLPGERMLDRLLDRDAVGKEQVREIAERVAAFHTGAEQSREIDSAGDPDNLVRFAIANFEETREVAESVFRRSLHRKLEERTRRDLTELMPTLRRRVEEGRVVDGHGDLHARNICLSEPIAIYDCLEFNRDFRCSDTALENAFLIMDLQFRGHPELARVYLESYIKADDDDEQPRLMPTLIRYRAMVRAKVSAIAAEDGELSKEERNSASDEARKYFHFAAASAIGSDGPWLVITCGLPGSGKSHTCRAIREETGWSIFGSDRIRKELAGAAPEDPLDSQFYRESFSRKTYTEMIRRGIEAARLNGAALIDANFRTRTLREMAKKTARAHGVKLAILFVDTPEPLILSRLAERTGQTREASDANSAIYDQLKTEFQRPEADESDRLVLIGGEGREVPPVAEIFSELLD